MAKSVPAIRVGSFLQIAPYLATRGLSSLEFFQRFGISPDIFQYPDIWLSRATCFQIANEMVKITDDPFGGAFVGHLTEIRSLGAWGEMILGSGHIGQACQLAAAHAELLHQGGEIKIINEGKTTRLIHQFTGDYGADPRQFILGTLAVLRKIPLMSGESSPIRVHIQNPREKKNEALEEYFGPDLVMNANYNMIEFDRGLLEVPLINTRDGASNTTRAITSTVKAASLLMTQLTDFQQPKLLTTSTLMGLSPRTLQRRLKHCGIEFEDLLDETRRSEALKLISNEKLTMTEIAYLVGYSDQAHFTRAFKRWTGNTPSGYRSEAKKG